MSKCEKCIHKTVCIHRSNIDTETYAYMGYRYDTEKCKHYMSDPAEEIFAEVKQALDISVETEHFKGSWFNMNKFMQSLAELKKKYTKGGKEQDG